MPSILIQKWTWITQTMREPIVGVETTSECAFSAAALTITKCHNRLKGDIVEAVQVLRMLYNWNLMFHEPPPSSALELDMEKEKNTVAAESADAEDWSWILELSDDSDVEA
ncbi:hypothetical protein BS17DRAFT_770782 [Gyrodon lividus]|nr:hypothetical protein BS17DRAFT_770782 [Gyrodon lividus]